MIPAVKGELRKIFTVRSTYVLLLFMLAVEVFFAFYATGYKAMPSDANNPLKLASEVTDAISFLALFASIVGLLLVTHEYRYNTILHTITLSKSRSKILLAKVVVISVFMIVISVVLGFLSPALAALGMKAHHLQLVPQTFDFWDLLWRTAFTAWGYGMLGLLLAAIIRVQVGAIVAFLLIPSLGEQLLSLLLKDNAMYLPFRSLSTVISGQMSHEKAALVVTIYIVVSYIVAWLLFLKRDAAS